MTDTGPTTGAIAQDEPIRREKSEILQARQEVTVSRFGTLAPLNLAQQLEVAQTMAKAGAAVPAHLRNSPGACLACIEYAHGWGFMTYALARQSYVVKDILCFDAQVVHAVIEKFAPLHEDSLNFEFKGKDDQMIALVWADCMIRGRVKKLEWESPEIGLILPKNSPLWKTKPKQQLWYNTSRDWARIHFPHILLGAYSNDELLDSETMRADAAREIGTVVDMNRRASGLAERLPGRFGEGEGFRPENVENIKGDRPRGPIIDHEELANIAADTPETSPPQTGQQAATQATANYAQQLGNQGTNAATAEPKREDPPFDPTPSPSKQEAKPAEPTVKDIKDMDSAGYVAHLKAWLERTTDDARIHDRYAEEKDDRTRCGVMGDDMKECQRLKKARLAELGSA